jgi:hypothetical protein
MLERVQIADSARALPVLVLGYSILMMHFVFSRAFRDSLLGSHLIVDSLPSLTVLGTLLAIALSLLLSFLVRTQERITVVRCLFVINAVVEVLMGLGYRDHPWIYSAYYIEVSASTALGISLIWVLIGDWTTRCHAKSGDKIPLILICGTAAGMFAGLAFVHIPGAMDFGTANFMLAGMHFAVVLALLLYRDDFCILNIDTLSESIAKGSEHLTRGLVRILAVVVIVGAATSTLLDLTFRVSIAETYTRQIDRLHFLGAFQSLLCLGALLTQLLMNRLQSLKMGMKVILLHPLVIFFTGLLAAVFPSFWVLGGYRTAEYALKNSTFRFGTERAFMALPDEARIETRPLIDVVGERMGDLAAAGLLQLLFVDNAHLPLRPALITVAVCSLLLLLVARTLAKRTDTLSQISASKVQIEQEISLQGLAKENSALV